MALFKRKCKHDNRHPENVLQEGNADGPGVRLDRWRCSDCNAVLHQVIGWKPFCGVPIEIVFNRGQAFMMWHTKDNAEIHKLLWDEDVAEA